jgi:hypothetical protein
MQNRHGLKDPKAAQVREALAEYHEARYRLQQLKHREPAPAEASETYQAFKRALEVCAKDEQAARDTLASTVASFVGAVPCAVIVDSAGGSSVVALSAHPKSTIVVAAADRVHIREVLCRPEPPPEFAHQFRQMAPNQEGVYLVMQRGDVVAVYNGVYFRSTNEVVADLQDLIHAGLEGVWSDDYVVWCSGRIMAVIHKPLDKSEQKLFLFNEPSNDPIAHRAIDPMPYWPTYAEWVESGRGDLWKTDRYP